MSFFIAEAHAQAAPAAQGSGFEPFIMLAVLGVFFYFMLVRCVFSYSFIYAQHP